MPLIQQERGRPEHRMYGDPGDTGDQWGTKEELMSSMGARSSKLSSHHNRLGVELFFLSPTVSFAVRDREIEG